MHIAKWFAAMALAVVSAQAEVNALALLPTTGQGDIARFKVSYAKEWTKVYVLVGDAIDPATSCLFGYHDNVFEPYRLVSEFGSDFISARRGDVPRNSRCHLLTEFGGGLSGVTERSWFEFAVAFSPTFTGTKKVWVLAANDTASTGWLQLGTWTVPAASGPGMLWFSPFVTNIRAADFQATFHHREGAAKHYLSYVLFLPTDSHVQFTATESCLIEYNRISDRVRLVNAAGTDWLPVDGASVGAGGVILDNGSCSVDTARMVILREDEILRLNGNVSFSNLKASPFLYATFLQAQDVNGRWTGMDQFATWQVPNRSAKPGLNLTSVGPFYATSHSPVTAAVTQTAPGLDAASVTMIHLMLANMQTGQTKCQIVYFAQSNTINLIDDTRTRLVADVSPVVGTAALLQNLACTVDVGKSTGFKSGNSVSVSAWVTGTPALGPVAIFGNAFDTRGHTTHWIQGGSFF
jgi:hypothetical protein